MSNPISLPDLTGTQEFQAVPLTNRLDALDAAFKYNANLFDETTFDKTPFSANEPWAKGRSLLANTYAEIRDTVAVSDLQNRLQRHAQESKTDIDPTIVSRIIGGGELDEEEDAGGALRGIVDGWTKDIASKPAPNLRKGHISAPVSSFPLLNPANDKEVLGQVSIFGDESTKPYAEIRLPDPDNFGEEILSRVLLDDDRELRRKNVATELSQMQKQAAQLANTPPIQTEDPYASAMGARDFKDDTAKAIAGLTERQKALTGPQSYATALKEQITEKLKQAPFIDKIGSGGWINGADSAIGSVLTSGMGIVPGVASLLGVGDETGPVQHVTDPKIVSKLVADAEAGKLEGMELTPYKDEDGNDGVTVRQTTDIEKMQRDQQDVRNMFSRRSRAEFRGSEWDRISVGATDDALPFLADLYSGMALAKGVMTPVRMAMTKGAASLSDEAAKLTKLAGAGNPAADLAAITASAKAAEGSLTAMKNIARYTTIPEALIAGLPMTVKGAAHSWSDAMHTADEFDAQGQGDKAEQARSQAFNSAWANFATGEGLSLLPMMRIMKNKNGDNLLDITDDLMSQRPGWKKFLDQQVFHRAKKSAEFGAWTGSTAMASNAWAKALYDDNRELMAGVPESTAIGMIHGLGLARFSGLVDPAEVRHSANKVKQEAQSIQSTKDTAAQALNRQKAGAAFDNLAHVLPSDAVVDQRTADKKWVINDPTAPAFHHQNPNAPTFNTREEAVAAAGTRHREQFFQSIAEYQQRIGMKPEDVNAQNVALGTSMDNVARLAGIDPARYYASITVRDRPEGREGPAPDAANMKARLDNLFDLIASAEKDKVPQLILDKMIARHEELRQQLPTPKLPGEEKPVQPWVKKKGVNDPPPAEPESVTPPSQSSVPSEAVTPPAQVGETPPVAKPSQSTPESQPGTERRSNPDWHKDRSIPQKEFESLVTNELATLQRLEAEAQAALQSGQLPEGEYQRTVDWITKRQSELQMEELARNDATRQKKDALSTQIAELNARIAEVVVKEAKVNPDSAQRAALITERRALQSQRKQLADELANVDRGQPERAAAPADGPTPMPSPSGVAPAPKPADGSPVPLPQPPVASRKLNQEQGKGSDDANASLYYDFADQAQVIIETYKNGNPLSLLHEVAHTWTVMKDPVTGKSLLETALGSKADAFNRWATVDGKWSTDSVEYHEVVAKGFEQYLGDGKAPTPELQGVFAKLARMFKKVYKDIKALGIDLPQEMRDGYDRLFDTQAKPDEARQIDDAPITPEQASAKLEFFEDGNLPGIHDLADPEFRRGLGEIAPTPVSPMPDSGAPQRLDQGPSKFDDFRTMVWSNKKAAKRKMADAWQRPSFWDRWENFIPAGMRSRGKQPVSMFEAKVAAHHLKDAITTTAEIRTNDLNHAINDALGINPNALNATILSPANQRARDALLRDVNSALMGQDNPAFSGLPRARKLALQAAAIAALPPNVQPHVKGMRAHIDALTRALIRTGAVQGPLVATLDANEGFYLNRTYEFFENPMHGDKVRKNDQPLMDQAVNEFMRGGMTRAQAEAEVEYLLTPDNFTGAATGEQGYAKFLTERRPTGIFKERSEIPEHIRKLWGEFKDPMLNYARTVAKQAGALTTFQYHLQTLADGTRDGWLKADRDKEHPVEIFKSDDQSPVTNPRKSPLSGYYTTPEIGAVFREVEQQGIGTDSFILSALAGGNWVAKNNVFTWNPASHVRNGVGSGILYFANGHYAGNRLWSNLSDVRGAVSAHAGILPEFWQRTLANNGVIDRNAANAERIRLTKLGLLGQNVDIGVLNNLAKRFANGVLSKNDAMNTVMSHLEGAVGKTQKGLEDAIQAEDSFWKVMHFYSEYKVLRDAYPSTGPGAKTNGELEIIAAGRTLDVMPSWDRVVPWAKKFSSNPFMGTFVSFRAETMRNTYNALKYGVQDLNTPGMRWHGIRRLAGMTGLRTAQGVAAKGLTKLMMGTFLDDDTDQKVRLLMNPWDVDSTQAYQHVGDGKIRHLNLSYILPMSETIDALRAVGNAENITSMGWKAFAKTFEPFLNEEFSLRLAHEIAFNKDSFGRPIYNTEDTPGGISWDALTHSASMMLEPAILKNVKRVVKAHQGTGTESPESAWSRIIGFRINEIDVRKQLPMVTADLANRVATADALFSENFDPAKGSDADLAAGFAKMNQRREFLFKRLHDVHEAGLATGVPHGEVVQLMDKAVDRVTKESLSKEELASAITGEFIPPYRLSKSKFIQLYEKNPDRAMKVLEMTGQPVRE